MIRVMTAMASAMLLAACGESMARPATPATVAPRPTPISATGLDRVMGQTAAELVRTFGNPDADIREGTARKLQFQGPICVLDTYLYPKGEREPVVTYVDARQPNGSPIDRASCVAALSRRGGGK